MGKGSAPRPFTDREVFDSNFDKIFRKKEFECNTACGHYECMEHKDQCKRLNKIILNKVNSPDVSPHAYEYELNKSTGEVQKSYSRIDVISQNGNEGLHYPDSLEQGTSKPNESQFDE